MRLSFKALAAQSFTLYYSTTTQFICNRHAFAHKCLGSRKRLTRFDPDGINSLPQTLFVREELWEDPRWSTLLLWLLLDLTLVLSDVAFEAKFRKARSLCVRFSVTALIPFTNIFYSPLATSTVWQPSKKIENSFICIYLFICLSILILMLLRMMVKYLLHILMKWRQYHIVAKFRTIDMALELVASSNVSSIDKSVIFLLV